MTSLADLVHLVLLSDSRMRLWSWQVFLRRQRDGTLERDVECIAELVVGIAPTKRSQREDLNPRPAVYETAALPLSYAGS